MTTEPLEPEASRQFAADIAAHLKKSDWVRPAAPVAQEPPAPGGARLDWNSSGTCGCGHWNVQHTHRQAANCMVDHCSCQRYSPAPGSAQESADPPWLTDAIKRAEDGPFGNPWTGSAIRSVLAYLRAGIEQELREKLAGDLERFRHGALGTTSDGWNAGNLDAQLHVRGQS